MWDMRIALCSGYEMKISESRKVRITEEVGRGAGCIVYDAIYWDQMKIKHKIRVKECYPAYLRLNRDSTGDLQPSSSNPAKFEEAKERFTDAYKRNTDIRNTLGLTNSTVNAVDVISCNHTVYILMPMDEGCDYKHYEDQSLQKLFGHMKSLAQIIQKYHQNRYLHLDIKPENVLILPETPEHVILFDFDSVTAFNELPQKTGIPYSDGFSAPEQMQGKTKKIGFHSDIYSIGAMLFYKLFGRKPQETECRIASSYSFEKMRYGSEKYQPKLYKMLELFFKKTLSTSTAPRWREMQNVIDALDELEKLSDIDDVYLLDSFQYNSACFVGRQDDLEEMDEILSKNQLVFLSGIGGIGKTELAKQYAQRHRRQYDTIIFAVYEKNIETLVRDEIGINRISREEDEKDRDYFKRKIEILKRTVTSNDLIIIDNFDVDADEDLETLFSCPCKFIITTRKDFRDYNYEQMDVDQIKDSQEILNLFYTYNTTDYTEKENDAVKQLIEYVEHHTMTVELIAKYLRNTETSPEVLYQRFLEKEGVTNTEEVRIRQRKDRKLRSESVNSHLKILFDISGFDKTEREIIASLSLFDGIRISRSQFETLCGIKEAAEKLDSFIQNGWIRWNGLTGKISLHQVIQDLVYHELAPDADNCIHIVCGMNEYLSVEPEIYAEKDVRKKIAAIFIKRLTGNNMPYARLCLRAGDEEKLLQAEQICLRQGDAEAYDLLQRIERKRIRIINDSIESDWYSTGIYENAFHKLDVIAERIDKAAAYCKKSSEDPNYLAREYAEIGSEVTGMLDAQMLWQSAKNIIPQMERIYDKISKVFDMVEEQMPLTSCTAEEKEKIYRKMRDFYACDNISYRSNFHLDMKKGYRYQKILNQLRMEHDLTKTADLKIKIDNELVVCQHTDDMSCAEVADEYEKAGNYKEAITWYKKVYEENYATLGGGEMFIADGRGYAVERIARIYQKMGDMDSYIKTLEWGCHDAHDRECYMELIRNFIKWRRFSEAKQYANELIDSIKLNLDSAYNIQVMIASYYFLYLIEEDKAEKLRLWEECLKYYKMLGTEEIYEECGDFLIEYMKNENNSMELHSMEDISMEEVLDVVGRVREYGKNNIRKTILQNVIRKQEGKKGFERYHVIFLVKLAELSNEYECRKVEEGLEICDQAQKIYNEYKLADEYLQSLIYNIRAELMYHGNFKYENTKEIRRMCNYKLLAEKQIAQKQYSAEKQIEIWKEAANQYSSAENGEMQEACLEEAIETAEQTWEKIETSEFWDNYWDMRKDLASMEIRHGKFRAAECNLALLYDKTIGYILGNSSVEDTGDNYWYISCIVSEYTDTTDTNEAIRVELAAMYILLEKKLNREILLDRENGIDQLCIILDELLEKEFETDTVDSMILMKNELQRILDHSTGKWECVSTLLQKISEKYQYKDFEFKQETGQK